MTGVNEASTLPNVLRQRVWSEPNISSATLREPRATVTRSDPLPSDIRESIMDVATFASKVKLCYTSFDLTGLESDLTMSSREIAELTGKEHFHVIRDIKGMLNAIQKDDPGLDHLPCEVKDSRGYVSEYLLNEELTLTLVSGYSVALRNKIVKQWLEMRTLIREQSKVIEKQAATIAKQQADRISWLETENDRADNAVRAARTLLEMVKPETVKLIKKDPELRYHFVEALEAFLADPNVVHELKGLHDNAVADLGNCQDKIKELISFIRFDCVIKPHVKRSLPNCTEELSYQHEKMCYRLFY